MFGFMKKLVLAFCAFGVCLAQLDPGVFYTHPLTDMPPKLPAVSVKYVLPDHGTKLIPAGDVVDVLVGVSNGSPDAVNVTAAMGSINSPLNFDFHLQNFSIYQYHMLVPPDQTASLLYQIRADPNLYAKDWQFALTLFYHSTGQRYSDTFFNESVTVVEADKTVDFEILFMYLILLGLLAVGGFFGYQALKDTPMMKKVAGGAKKPARKSGAGGAGDDPDQWLAGTQYAKDLKKRNQKQKKKEDQ